MRLIPIASVIALLISCNGKQKRDPLNSNIRSDSCYHTKVNLLLQDGIRIGAEKYAVGSNEADTIFASSYYSIPFNSNHSVRYYPLLVPSKTQYGFTLNGTKIFLNAATAFQFSELGAKPQQYKITGKANIETSADSAIIDAGDVMIYLGSWSKVNIVNYSDEPSAIISSLEGKIKVTKRSYGVVLKAGQQIVINRSNPTISVQDCDSSEAIDWTRGWNPIGPDLPYMFREISRLYDLSIAYPDGDVEGNMIAFNFRTKKIDDLIKAFNDINYDQNIAFKRNGETIFIAKKYRGK